VVPRAILGITTDREVLEGGGVGGEGYPRMGKN
jgi:hypothetical protein